MALVAMMVTGAMGMGLFAPPAIIAGIVLGPEAAMNPSLVVIATGLILHMVLSMMFGVVFAALTSRTLARRNHPGPWRDGALDPHRTHQEPHAYR